MSDKRMNYENATATGHSAATAQTKLHINQTFIRKIEAFATNLYERWFVEKSKKANIEIDWAAELGTFLTPWNVNAQELLEMLGYAFLAHQNDGTTIYQIALNEEVLDLGPKCRPFTTIDHAINLASELLLLDIVDEEIDWIEVCFA